MCVCVCVCVCVNKYQFKFKTRQHGNPPEIISYADKANERLRRKYYRMVLKNGKKANVAKTAVARELACFMWGMVTGSVA